MAQLTPSLISSEPIFSGQPLAIKFEAIEILHKDNLARGPILQMEEMTERQSLCATEVDHPPRGWHTSVGSPIKPSDSAGDVTPGVASWLIYASAP